MQLDQVFGIFVVAALCSAQNLESTTLTENGHPVATYPTNYDPSTAPTGAVLTTVSQDGSGVATYPIGSAATSYVPNTDATGSSSMVGEATSSSPSSSSSDSASASNLGSAVTPLAAMGGIMGAGLAAVALL